MHGKNTVLAVLFPRIWSLMSSVALKLSNRCTDCNAATLHRAPLSRDTLMFTLSLHDNHVCTRSRSLSSWCVFTCMSTGEKRSTIYPQPQKWYRNTVKVHRIQQPKKAEPDAQHSRGQRRGRRTCVAPHRAEGPGPEAVAVPGTRDGGRTATSPTRVAGEQHAPV